MLQALHLLTVPNTKDSWESAHLLSAGLYLDMYTLPAGSTAGTPDSPPPSRTLQTPPLSSAGSPTVYTWYT